MMGKRSSKPARPQGNFPTPYKAALPLAPFIRDVETFAEPCCGRGDLVGWLEGFGLRCVYQNDIEYGGDALTTGGDFGRPNAIITNPPWESAILLPLIERFMRVAPTWLLLNADFMHNKYATPYLRRCTDIITIGRVKWIPGSPHDSGMENAIWARFDRKAPGMTVFHGRRSGDVFT